MHNLLKKQEFPKVSSTVCAPVSVIPPARTSFLSVTPLAAVLNGLQLAGAHLSPIVKAKERIWNFQQSPSLLANIQFNPNRFHLMKLSCCSYFERLAWRLSRVC